MIKARVDQIVKEELARQEFVLYSDCLAICEFLIIFASLSFVPVLAIFVFISAAVTNITSLKNNIKRQK
jgi:hypothetical protein